MKTTNPDQTSEGSAAKPRANRGTELGAARGSVNRADVIFACGAKIKNAEITDLEVGGKLVVFDTASPLISRPKLEGKPAPCMACPCCKKARRKYYRCFPPDDKLPKDGVWRHVVVCRLVGLDSQNKQIAESEQMRGQGKSS